MSLSQRPQPLGLTLIALIFLFEALAALGLAAFLLLSPTGATAYGALFDRLAWPAALSSLLAVPPLLTAALAGMVFRGLWRLAAWARMAALVISFLFVLLAIAVIAFLAAFAALDAVRIMAAAAGLIIAGFAFIYLLRARIEGPEPTGPSAPAAALPQAPLAPPGKGERPPIPAPSPAVAPPIAGVPAVVGVAGNLVPPPPRPRPGRESGSAVAAAALHDSDTLASAPSTQQLAPAPSAAADPAIAWLVVRSGQQLGQSFALHPGQTLVLGRDPARANAVLSDPTVSGLHAQLRLEHGRFVIYDLGSTNGTFLGSETGYTTAIQRQPLQDGDELRLGGVSLLFTTGKP